MTKSVWLLALVLTMGVLTAAPASAYEPPDGATFNVPRPWGTAAQRLRIINSIEQAINQTPPGATIMVTTFLLDRGASVAALTDACKRGVSVRAVLDGAIDTDVSRRLIASLNGDNVVDADNDGVADAAPKAGPCNSALPGQSRTATADTLTPSEAASSAATPTDASVTWGGDRSYAKMCLGSCRGAGGNMHSKFYLFSQTGDAHDVVMVSSANLNKGGVLNGWNDLYVMKNSALYSGYQAIHREMTEDSQADDQKVELVSGPFTARFFPMRNASQANDPTLLDLNQVSCHSAFGPTKINVSMFYWAGDRGDYLAAKLINLAKRGCAVSVIYGAPSREVASKLRTAARAGLLKVYDSRWDMDGDGLNEVRTHSKYVLVKGAFGADTSSWQVLTGSANWVAGSLSRGDETTLNIALESAWKDYYADWSAIRQHSRRVPAPR